MGVPYYERLAMSFTCADCGWTGVGSQLEAGELFEDLVEFDCPNCSRRITFSVFPSLEEARAAAVAGNEEAAHEVEHILSRQDRWRRVVESRDREIATPIELDGVPVRAVLELKSDDRGETWLTLSANGIEIYRELAV